MSEKINIKVDEKTFNLIDAIDTKLDMLCTVQRMLTRRAFANYEKIGDECTDINIAMEEAEELWALSEQIYEQLQNIRLMLQPITKG